MKNAEYWASRFLDLKKETENQTFEYMETVEREFRKASRKIHCFMQMPLRLPLLLKL